MTTFDHDRALAYEWPISLGWSVIFDRVITIVIAIGKPRICFVCGEEILLGQEARVRYEIRQEPAPATGRFFRACALCCSAMAKAGEDGGATVETRKGLRGGRERRVG